MRVLFVVFPEPGHLNPMICVAQQLVRDGHEVCFFSMEDLSPRLAAAGLPARCYVAEVGAHTGRRAARNRDLATLLGKPALARRFYRYGLVTQVPAQIAALREVVSSTRPDVIATDPFAYAGVVVAEQASIPWAAISTQLLALAPAELRWPYLDYLEDPELVAERARLFASEGVSVPFELAEAISPWLFTVFATEELARPRGHAICVGPSSPVGRRGDQPAFPWDRLREGVPLVYASFGSQLAPPAAIYEALVHALGPDEADLVIALGDSEPPSSAAHVTAIEWAPQLALLDRAAAMVTHGGANSIAECLMRGTPSLVVPLGHDQPLQAYLIERSGAGLALAPDAVTEDSLAHALRALLADGTYRHRAAELARSYAASDGSRRTAELLVELGRTRQPIRG